MSKILKITMVLVMTFFAIFLTPQERAHAIGPILAAEGAFLGGAAVYVGGALLVGGIAAVAGCESCQEDIEAHAQRTWDGSTQLAKDSLQAMINASVGVGTALTATDANFNAWMDTQIDSIITDATNIVNYSNVGYQASITPTNTTYRYSVQSAWDNCRYGNSVNTCWASADTMQTGYAAHSIVNNVMTSTKATKININLDSNKAYGTTVGGSYSVILTNAKWDTVRAMMHTGMSVVEIARVISYVTGNMIMYSAIGATTYNAVSANTREVWQDMKDAGLVLPTDNARPMYNNQPVTYNPDTDSYAGIDGITVPRDGITFDYQRPHYKTNEDLIALGGAAAGLGAGLYIDGWVETTATSTSTYDPATDITTTVTTGTGTTTNVTTGETAITGATTTTTTGDTTGNPSKTPEGTTPKTQTGKANRWGKLVTTKFPFSLPWDLFFILSFMNADPVPPVFEVDERILKRENVEGIQIKFAIDLSFLDPYVPWFRRFLVLGFAFFLVMNTRKLLGGAQ